MKKQDKFKVGDTAWWPGDSWRRERKFIPYRVTERTKTGYIMQPSGVQIGALNVAEKVSTILANRDYYTTQAKEDVEWQWENRHKVLLMASGVDTATLRKIADLIGYKPAKEPHA